MSLNVARELAALQRMTVKELRARYAEVFGEATNAKNKAWLVKRIAWRLQAFAEGDLSERARRRAEQLANDADLRLSPPKAKLVAAAEPPAAKVLPFRPDDRLPLPGTIIVRDYNGRRIEVTVLTAGFEHEGEVYKSLSAVARAVTGAHCNGYLFFRLNQNGGAR